MHSDAPEATRVADDHASEGDSASNANFSEKLRTRLSAASRTVRVHVTKHVGAGILASVAYFDPGNWSVDLQAGSQYGYSLLVIVLIAGIGAVILQSLACRLGCVTGLDLASHCRLLFNNHPTHPKLVRWTLLYPLYVLCEIAIIATDLAELLGSAIAICLLIPQIPLWGGVLITSADVLVVLIACQSNNKRPVRVFEYCISALVLATFVCFVVLIAKVHPIWPLVFRGYVPSKDVFQPGPLYISIGILGATVMPHALFLGSAWATLDRVSVDLPAPPTNDRPVLPAPQRLKKLLKSLVAVTRASDEKDPLDRSTPHGLRDNNSQNFVSKHLNHGIVDIIMSLLGFAMLINSAILILAATVFFYGPGTDAPAGLFDAYHLIRSHLGHAAGVVFALALFCSGQSASITATLSGQIVSEGFIEWKVSPVMRRTITRLLGLIPSTVVAVTVGQRGIDTLLVASQVALSIVLPFVVFPLVYLTSSPVVMRVQTETGYKSYHNSRFMSAFGYFLFLVMLTANGYVIVTLALKKD